MNIKKFNFLNIVLIEWLFQIEPSVSAARVVFHLDIGAKSREQGEPLG